MTARRIAGLAAAASAVLACGLVLVTSAPSAPSARAAASAPVARQLAPAVTAPSVPYPACFGKATPLYHAQIASHIAYECLGVGGSGDIPGTSIPKPVGVYWSDNLYGLAYYLHPGHGGVVVFEDYFKTCAQVQQERHGAACGLYDGVPVADAAAGANPWANGRLIWSATGCIFSAPTDTGAVPATCSAVILDGGRTVGPGRPMTAAEIISADEFWWVMSKDTPDGYW